MSSYTIEGNNFCVGQWEEFHHDFAGGEYGTMLEMLDIKPGESILDVGCGIGLFTDQIREKVGPKGKVYAMDLAMQNVSAVNTRMATEPRAQLTQGDASLLPYKDGSFDRIWSGALVEYLPDAELMSFLCECKRVLKPGGTLVVKDCNAESLIMYPEGLSTFVHSLFKTYLTLTDSQLKNPQTNYGYNEYGYFRPERMEEIFLDAGFINVEQEERRIERKYPISENQFDYICGTVLGMIINNYDSDMQNPFVIFLRKMLRKVTEDPKFSWSESHLLTRGISQT